MTSYYGDDGTMAPIVVNMGDALITTINGFTVMQYHLEEPDWYHVCVQNKDGRIFERIDPWKAYSDTSCREEALAVLLDFCMRRDLWL